MKRNLLFLLIIFSLFSCRKETGEIQIDGKLNDPYGGNYVAGATISLQATGVIDGVYSAAYTTIASGTTDTDGRFSFVINESAYDAFRFTFIKDGYFMSQNVYSASTIDPEHPFSGSFEIYSRSAVKVSVQNILPYDNSDEISVYFANPPSSCSECCTSDPFKMTGMNIDTIIYCNSYGGYELVINYSYKKNNINSSYSDTVVCTPFDTTYHSITF